MKTLVLVLLTALASVTYAECDTYQLQAAVSESRKKDIQAHGEASLFRKTITDINHMEDVSPYAYDEDGKLYYRATEILFLDEDGKEGNEGFSVYVELDRNCKLKSYKLVDDVICRL